MADEAPNGESEELAIQEFVKILRSALILTRGNTYRRRFLNIVMDGYKRTLLAIVENGNGR